MPQLRKDLRLLSTLALLAVALPAVACDDDDSSTGNQLSNADLVGDWSMISFQIVPQQAVTPPAATGRLQLTNTDYQLLIVLNTIEGVDTVANDSGTYNVSGSSWSQTSANPALPQSTGTVSLTRSGSAETIVVNATAGGVTTHSIWRRQQ